MTDKSMPEGEIRMMQVTHDHLLNEAVKITQPADGYRVGTDAVLLAAAISTSSGRVLDLGSGVGGVCLCCRLQPSRSMPTLRRWRRKMPRSTALPTGCAS